MKHAGTILLAEVEEENFLALPYKETMGFQLSNDVTFPQSLLSYSFFLVLYYIYAAPIQKSMNDGIMIWYGLQETY